MRNLKELEMREPNLQQLNLRKQWVMQFGPESVMRTANWSSRTCRD